jgi:hypothetical protein
VNKEYYHNMLRILLKYIFLHKYGNIVTKVIY